MNSSNQFRLIKLCGILGIMLLSTSVCAGDIRVEKVWARATAPGQSNAMADMTITSRQDATLTGVSSAASKTVALHSMTHENGMMKMREVQSLHLPAGKRINLGESGYHLMLTGLNSPLRVGEAVPLTLTFSMAGQHTEKIQVKAEVRPFTSTHFTPEEDGHGQHHH